MAHIEDRWYRVVKQPGGGTAKVKTARFGQGNRTIGAYVHPSAGRVLFRVYAERWLETRPSTRWVPSRDDRAR